MYRIWGQDSVQDDVKIPVMNKHARTKPADEHTVLVPALGDLAQALVDGRRLRYHGDVTRVFPDGIGKVARDTP